MTIVYKSKAYYVFTNLIKYLKVKDFDYNISTLDKSTSFTNSKA